MAIEFKNGASEGGAISFVLVDGEMVAVIGSFKSGHHALFNCKTGDEVRRADTLDEMKAFCREYFA